MKDKFLKMSESDCSKTCGPREIPTNEEKEALDALRAIKDRVREVKTKLGEVTRQQEAPEASVREELEMELEKLREEWKVWEERREEAARARMIALGHEDPD